MNILVENKYIYEMDYGTSFSYILSDNSAFLSTEYKVLQSQANGCFIRCMKMLFNGNVQLCYITDGYKPFSSLISTLDAENFMTIVANLLFDIIEVKSNGFLSCRNIDTSFDRIYIDPTTYKVKLVYLPLSKRIYNDDSTFENEIRTGLVKLISGISMLYSPRTMQLSADLSNGILTIEDLYARIKGGKSIIDGNPIDDKPIETSSGLLRIIAMNIPNHVEITVNKDEFVIGKKPETCDGVLSFNNMISRTHCKICKSGNQYTVTDLKSANGTYVNKVKLQPNLPYPIKNGDILRLANSDFQVTIE